MLEKYQILLERLKQPSEIKPKQDINYEFIQNVFEMQDVNKWLKFNATTEEQLKRVEDVEDNLQSILKKLYVPQSQIVNV